MRELQAAVFSVDSFVPLCECGPLSFAPLTADSAAVPRRLAVALRVLSIFFIPPFVLGATVENADHRFWRKTIPQRARRIYGCE